MHKNEPFMTIFNTLHAAISILRIIKYSNDMITERLTASTQMPRLTPRETEIVHLLAHEYSSKEIAQKIFVSYETVHSHRKNILHKLKVRNVAGIVRVAFETGILSVA